MSSVRANFAANLAGQGWAMLIQVLAVPLYIKFLGIEAYGLIGFFVALQTTVQMLDLGFGQTLTREIARRRASDCDLSEARSLVTTVGVVYACIAALIGLAVILAAPVLASKVIHAGSLDRETVRHSIVMMGLLIPALWGVNLFQGALAGMERQVLANAIRIAMTSIGAAGAILVLWLVSAEITAFFAWQLFTAVAGWLAAGWTLHRVLPGTRPVFSANLLREVWRFAAGLSGIAVGGVILTQLDKWLLINMLPLESYGHYVLAAVAANALYLVITPLFNSVFPRMTALHAASDEAGLARLYHGSTQYIAALVLPLAAVIALFSEQLLWLWTRDAAVARGAAPVVSILVCGTALNGLMNVPYALQVASGRTRLALGLVIMQVILFGPAIVFLTIHLGTTGAALAWVLLNAVYVAVGIPLTHAWILKGEAGAWIVKDVLPPAAATLAVTVTADLLQPTGTSALPMLLFVGATAAVALFAAVMAADVPRAWLVSHARRLGH